MQSETVRQDIRVPSTIRPVHSPFSDPGLAGPLGWSTPRPARTRTAQPALDSGCAPLSTMAEHVRAQSMRTEGQQGKRKQGRKQGTTRKERKGKRTNSAPLPRRCSRLRARSEANLEACATRPLLLHTMSRRGIATILPCSLRSFSLSAYRRVDTIKASNTTTTIVVHSRHYLVRGAVVH